MQNIFTQISHFMCVYDRMRSTVMQSNRDRAMTFIHISIYINLFILLFSFWTFFFLLWLIYVYEHYLWSFWYLIRLLCSIPFRKPIWNKSLKYNTYLPGVCLVVRRFFSSNRQLQLVIKAHRCGMHEEAHTILFIYSVHKLVISNGNINMSRENTAQWQCLCDFFSCKWLNLLILFELCVCFCVCMRFFYHENIE